MSFVREPNAEPIPGYRLIEHIGTGGFGEVWKCEAPGGILKAIKFVFGNLNSLDVDAASAQQELKSLNCIKEVRHPFVLSVERFDIQGGELAIVMELADKNLNDVFEECQAAGMVGIPRSDLVRYIKDAAEALDHMILKHSLLHLDVKPRNLFLISDRVKVADFGLVKPVDQHTGGMLSGVTPLYASPETYAGRMSPQSDQYSLAIVYQEMLTGQRPFNGKNARQLMLQHTQAEPELRPLPEAERPVIARALAKEPAKRFPDCMSFVLALYTARAAVRPEVLIPAEAKAADRPRTAAETVEDLLLERMAGEVANGHTHVLDEANDTPKDAAVGLTQAAPQTGSLRPTLVIGVGGFSRRALMELRCRFLDRFGDLNKLPLLHFLYIDPDPEAIRLAVRGAPELTCTAEEVFHLPLQPIANYRRRMIEQLGEWLPHEKLYNMPRSLQTQGIRALGRLAYVDHQQRLLGKIKREVQKIATSEALYQSVTETGLALRSDRPRVYVIASASGGSGGLLPDLGFALRRLLQQLRYTDSEVTALLFCGAPDDPATPPHEQANVYATLTELNHFCDPDIPFTAQYGADGPRVSFSGPPFDHVYLLKLAHRTPEALRDAVAHLGSYLFHEITTPLGIHLEGDRRRRGPSDATRFRSLGTHAVWFPRGLLLRLAARQACLELLRHWQEEGEPSDPQGVEEACAGVLALPEIQFPAICKQLEEGAAAAFDGNLNGTLAHFLSGLEEQSLQGVAQDNPGAWARQAVHRVQEWVGNGHGPSHEHELQKSKLSRALGTSCQQLAEQWDQQLAQVAFGLMDWPGRRVAAAEKALARFVRYCNESIKANQVHLDEQFQRTQAEAEQMDQALNNCVSGQGGGFALFGGKSRKLLRGFVDAAGAFSRQCLQEGLVAFGLRFYTALRSRLEERKRELAFCRQRLRNMEEDLLSPDGAPGEGPANRFEVELTPVHSPLPSAEAYWDTIRESETARLVLPNGESDLERAAQQFLEGLREEDWQQLGTVIQEQVLSPLGGLYHICVTNADLARHLARPLLTEIAGCLGNMLPITDVAQVEFTAAEAGNVKLLSRVQEYFKSAAPVVAGKDPARQHGFLLIPASDAGKSFGEEARQAVPEVETVRVAGQADLMFCREQGYLTPEELRPLLHSCKRAYEESAVVPNTSPHARFDITDWVPLDP
jgi:hypothetical protein